MYFSINFFTLDSVLVFLGRNGVIHLSPYFCVINHATSCLLLYNFLLRKTENRLVCFAMRPGIVYVYLWVSCGWSRISSEKNSRIVLSWNGHNDGMMTVRVVNATIWQKFHINSGTASEMENVIQIKLKYTPFCTYTQDVPTRKDVH